MTVLFISPFGIVPKVEWVVIMNDERWQEWKIVTRSSGTWRYWGISVYLGAEFILSRHAPIPIKSWTYRNHINEFFFWKMKIKLTWHALFLALVSAVLGISWFGLLNLFSRRSHDPHPSENLPPLKIKLKDKFNLQFVKYFFAHFKVGMRFIHSDSF